MSKIYKNFYPQIYDLLNLWQAFVKASKGRRGHPSIAAFEYNLEPELIRLRDELRDETYLPGGYRSFTVHETKRRKISAAPFRDRVVHHALMNVTGPMLERKFIHDSYANQIGKGTHKALDRCTYFMRRYDYVLPCDVRQFFPSIDHEILESVLSNTLKDESAMDLIRKIVSSGEGVLNEEYDMTYFVYGCGMSAVEESPGDSRPSFPVRMGKYKIAPFPLSDEIIGMGQNFSKQNQLPSREARSVYRLSHQL